jgi:hypothetical protein
MCKAEKVFFDVSSAQDDQSITDIPQSVGTAYTFHVRANSYKFLAKFVGVITGNKIS